MLRLLGVATMYGNVYMSQPPAGWSQAPQVLTNAPPARRRNHVWVDSWLIHYVQVMKQNILK